MTTDHSPVPAPWTDDGESLDALLDSSRRLRRFWPQVAAGPQPAAPSPAGVLVSSGAQRVVAGMAEYGF
ncbi:hypothetical protein [Kitasatospora brasiliensis]|uniref:hypothetical protein n=1 Tax=Kitasatospora brasiliensis TaxID=3058040 RepID=UPI002931BFCD|nr:hypothetical protein [Kitasatospora sp. K002]